MTKKIILILIAIFSISCERDDVCLDPITSKLIIRFYDDIDNTLLKSVTNLSIEVDSLGVFVPITVISSDSIAIPLRVDEDITKIRLTKNTGDLITESIDNFTLNYLRDEVFVSRSCGYKTTYSDMSETDLTSNWISSLTINNQNVADETAKHISIFH